MWTSRLSRVWLVSIAARATVVPVALFAASSLRTDHATVLALVALSGSGVLGTIIAFLYDAAFASGRDYPKGLYSFFLGVLVVLTAGISTITADAGPLAGLIVLLAYVALRPTVEARQRLLHSGALLIPYMAVVLRNVGLLFLLGLGRNRGGNAATVVVALAFLSSSLLELAINRFQARRIPLTAEAEAGPPVEGNLKSLSLPIAYTLFCVMPWTFRVVIATFVGVQALKLVEYGDRLSYLAVSIVLGGSVTELQRRWTRMPSARTAYREATALSGLLLGMGLVSGVVAAVFSPRIFRHIVGTDQAAVLLLGASAGAWGAITVAQRLLITVLKHWYLARHLIPFEATSLALVIGGGYYFGFLGSSAMYALTLVALALFLFRPEPEAAVVTAAPQLDG